MPTPISHTSALSPFSAPHRWLAPALAMAVGTLGLGLALAAGGAWLVMLGGSAYHLIAGVVLLVDAVLLWRQSRGGLRDCAAAGLDIKAVYNSELGTNLAGGTGPRGGKAGDFNLSATDMAWLGSWQQTRKSGAGPDRAADRPPCQPDHGGAAVERHRLAAR